LIQYAVNASVPRRPWRMKIVATAERTADPRAKT
jgi:hypothetical protein